MKTKKNIPGNSRNRPETETLVANFKKNYQDIYYGRETVAIKAINDLPGKEMGVKIALCSPVNAFSHFLCSMTTRVTSGAIKLTANYSPSGSEVFRELQDNTIVANRFVDNEQIQEKIFLIRPVFTDGRTSGPYTISIRYIPSKFYKAQKMSGHPHIILILCEPRLNIGTGAIDDWVIAKPTRAEKKFAARKWGKLVKRAKTNYDKAKILAKTLMHDLWPHDGFPSDAMHVPPFQQYERMVSGRDKGYCGTFTNIFVCACNALGIPARHIGIREIYSNSDKCKKMNIQIQGGSCHGVPEIFDEHLNQWIWMDLRLYALGAWLGDVGPLTLAEFHFFLNQEQRRKNLKLLVYDMDKKIEKMLPLAKCPKYPASFTSFLGWDTDLCYKKLNAEK